MKLIDSHPILAREGWFYLALTLFAAIVTSAVFPWYVAILFWVIFLFVLQFFRDPHRQIPEQDNALISPADGKVIFTGVVDDPYLDRKAFKISVFMNVFSVHSNRAPVAGTVKKVWYHPGLFVNAAFDKASEQNERNAIWLQTAEGRDVISVQVAGLVARRILCYVKQGDSLEQGQRYGYIRFGSRVDLFLPVEFSAAVKLGDNVSSGTSILGSFTA
ncbi:phosphatidylserine decarboxylase proenzyme [Arenicella chitinivorans]|uniref:Phosphatidylserine decarboxylase proenzyme n=1 Tax=Arenicella chitinivorans TaxID=1329800 RepID=A0A918RI27_9GAMM|nr:phosphatidylserine decarboxylase [Arenicella chitinivorans]GHA00809.1 phosphatidylserine decarboxylase proenzyme [Arenicella chitinivorans]